MMIIKSYHLARKYKGQTRTPWMDGILLEGCSIPATQNLNEFQAFRLK